MPLFKAGADTGQMIGGGVILCHSLKLGPDTGPDDWRRSYIMPLFKAGNEEATGIYREIAQGSCEAKVMTRVLAGRLSVFRSYSIRGSGWIQARERMC